MRCITLVPHVLVCDWAQLHPSNQCCCCRFRSCVITKICKWIGPAYSANLFGTSVLRVKGTVALTLFTLEACNNIWYFHLRILTSCIMQSSMFTLNPPSSLNCDSPFSPFIRGVKSHVMPRLTVALLPNWIGRVFTSPKILFQVSVYYLCYWITSPNFQEDGFNISIDDCISIKVG